MDNHFHHTLDAVLFTTVAVVLTIHVVRFGAAKLAAQPGALGHFGGALGAVFSFPATTGQ